MLAGERGGVSALLPFVILAGKEVEPLDRLDKLYQVLQAMVKDRTEVSLTRTEDRIRIAFLDENGTESVFSISE